VVEGVQAGVRQRRTFDTVADHHQRIEGVSALKGVADQVERGGDVAEVVQRDPATSARPPSTKFPLTTPSAHFVPFAVLCRYRAEL
jgi:hypothetical protein